MEDMNILITGISRGIGLGLARKVLDEGHQVLGIARNPDTSSELRQLQSEYPQKLQVLALDLRSDNAASQIQTALKNVTHIDILINNAGILDESTSKQSFLESFEVNTYVPFMTTEALLPWLKKSSHPLALHISSTMGSISDNSSGGYYAYRSSKSALNMINKSLSVDHHWLTTVVIHPGWVQTRMGGPAATTPVEESVLGIWKVVKGLKHTDTGLFFDYRGNMLPW